jgi:hypothetical protein
VDTVKRSLDANGKATSTTVSAVMALVSEIAAGVRSVKK